LVQAEFMAKRAKESISNLEKEKRALGAEIKALEV